MKLALEINDRTAVTLDKTPARLVYPDLGPWPTPIAIEVQLRAQFTGERCTGAYFSSAETLVLAGVVPCDRRRQY